MLKTVQGKIWNPFEDTSPLAWVSKDPTDHGSLWCKGAYIDLRHKEAGIAKL